MKTKARNMSVIFKSTMGLFTNKTLQKYLRHIIENVSLSHALSLANCSTFVHNEFNTQTCT